MEYADKGTEALAAIPQLSSSLPQGGMFLMVDVSRTGLDGEQFAWRLLEQQQVAVMPGSVFGDCGTPLVRVALTVPDDTLLEAVQRMALLCDQLEAAAVISDVT